MGVKIKTIAKSIYCKAKLSLDSPRLDVELYSFLATHNRRRRRLNEEDIKKEVTTNRD
jgi:hypothetical protein